jgi:ketosteroid isomerase-like protein
MIILIFKNLLNMKNLLFFLILSVCLGACTSSQKQFDLANAKKEIEAINLEMASYISKSDSVGLASAYSKEGALMLSNRPTVSGQENITRAWGDIINAGVSKMTLTTLDVWGNEEYITEEGLISIETKDGTLLDKGKYLVLWKKEDGKWKLHRDISNSDLPLPK